MKTRTQKFLMTLALSLGVITTAAAERVFPPDHLDPAARFGPAVGSTAPVALAWYQAGRLASREALAATETRTPSPYPSMYYFVNIRSHANDESERLAALRAQRYVDPVEVVRATRADQADGDDS